MTGLNAKQQVKEKGIQKREGKSLEGFFAEVFVLVLLCQQNVTVEMHFLVGGHRSWPLPLHSVCGQDDVRCEDAADLVR